MNYAHGVCASSKRSGRAGRAFVAGAPISYPVPVFACFILAMFLTGCDENVSVCVTKGPESLAALWRTGDPDLSTELKAGKRALMPDPDSRGHLNARFNQDASCSGTQMTLEQLNTFLERIPESANPNACQMIFEIDRGRLSQTHDYRSSVFNTGAYIDSFGTWEAAEYDSKVFAEIDGYETCEDLEAAVQFVLDGRVIELQEGPLPHLRRDGSIDLSEKLGH
jgi:hypothetical protein